MYDDDGYMTKNVRRVERDNTATKLSKTTNNMAGKQEAKLQTGQCISCPTGKNTSSWSAFVCARCLEEYQTHLDPAPTFANKCAACGKKERMLYTAFLCQAHFKYGSEIPRPCKPCVKQWPEVKDHTTATQELPFCKECDDILDSSVKASSPLVVSPATCAWCRDKVEEATMVSCCDACVAYLTEMAKEETIELCDPCIKMRPRKAINVATQRDAILCMRCVPDGLHAVILDDSSPCSVCGDKNDVAVRMDYCDDCFDLMKEKRKPACPLCPKMRPGEEAGRLGQYYLSVCAQCVLTAKKTSGTMCSLCGLVSDNPMTMQSCCQCYAVAIDNREKRREKKETKPPICEPCANQWPEKIPHPATRFNLPFCEMCVPLKGSQRDFAMVCLDKAVKCSWCSIEGKVVALVDCCDKLDLHQQRPKMEAKGDMKRATKAEDGTPFCKNCLPGSWSGVSRFFKNAVPCTACGVRFHNVTLVSDVKTINVTLPPAPGICEPCAKDWPSMPTHPATKHGVPFCEDCLPAGCSGVRQSLKDAISCAACGEKTDEVILVSCCDTFVQHPQQDTKDLPKACVPCATRQPNALPHVATKDNVPFCKTCLPDGKQHKELDDPVSCAGCGFMTQVAASVSCCDTAVLLPQKGRGYVKEGKHYDYFCGSCCIVGVFISLAELQQCGGCGEGSKFMTLAHCCDDPSHGSGTKEEQKGDAKVCAFCVVNDGSDTARDYTEMCQKCLRDHEIIKTLSEVPASQFCRCELCGQLRTPEMKVYTTPVCDGHFKAFGTRDWCDFCVGPHYATNHDVPFCDKCFVSERKDLPKLVGLAACSFCGSENMRMSVMNSCNDVLRHKQKGEELDPLKRCCVCNQNGGKQTPSDKCSNICVKCLGAEDDSPGDEALCNTCGVWSQKTYSEFTCAEHSKFTEPEGVITLQVPNSVRGFHAAIKKLARMTLRMQRKGTTKE